jgi:hypothetical protein
MSNASRWPTGRLGEQIAARVVCEQLLARFHANVDAGFRRDDRGWSISGLEVELVGGGVATRR